MTQSTEGLVTDAIEQAFEFICRKYVQRADDRQRSMGLQYTEAETHDLAKRFVEFAAMLQAQPADVEAMVEKAYREGWRVNAIPEDDPATSPEYLQACEDADWAVSKSRAALIATGVIKG